jgi:DNA-binding NtrC family response regulator
MNTPNAKEGKTWLALDTPSESIGTIAATDSTVLILGETGAGKGALAWRMHEMSPRRDKAFVEIYCPALRGEGLKNELFGHAKNAAANAAADSIGLIEEADGGTLFLDEIGGMPMKAQCLLIKAVEEKAFRRVGENRWRESDFRLICSTSRNLRAAVTAGEFREELFYRISAFPVTIAPLRCRKEKIPSILASLSESLGYAEPLSDDVVKLLTLYPWPGNIRLLKNALLRALVCANGSPLSPEHFFNILSPESTFAATAQFAEEAAMLGQAQEPISNWSLDDFERAHLLRALEHFGGDKFKASEALGISLSTIYRKLDKIWGGKREAEAEAGGE